MHATAEVLEDNKVKLTVEVDEEELKTAEDETFRRLVREARLPGFRPGKVPRKVLEVRLGAKTIREEVLRDAMPRYYADALEEHDIDAIAAPEIDITTGEDGGPFAFDAVVEVRPQVSIVGYQGLVVTLPRSEPTDEEIDAQLDRLREQFATLAEVDREARQGDLVTVDIHSTRDGEPAEGLTADGLVYEVGSGGIVAGADERLIGAKVGEEYELDAEDAPGGPAHLQITLRQVREKVLPAADDTFAADASEFETLAELRSDLGIRMAQMRRMNAASQLREEALAALVELVSEDPPVTLVTEQFQKLMSEYAHELSHRKLTLDSYLRSTGQQPEAFFAGLEDEAGRLVKADLALRALAAAEGIEADESDVDNEIVRLAPQAKQNPAEFRLTLERENRLDGLRSQLRISKAVTWLIEHVSIVDDEGQAMDRGELGIGDERSSQAVSIGSGEA